MDKTTVQEETMPEEKPQEEKNGRKNDKKAPQKGGNGHKGKITAAFIVLAVIAIVVLAVFVVYGGRHIWLRTELGQGMPEASEFMKNSAEASYVDAPEVSLEKEGTYVLKVKSGGKVRPQLLFVRDTKAPEAEAIDAKISIDETSMAPEDALGEITDASEYTVKWLTEPTYGEAGAYDCRIELADVCGNSRKIDLTVKVMGLVDVLEYEMGRPHPGLSDFMAVERDNVKFLTDLDEVDWNKTGEYEVKAEFDGKTFTSVLRIVDTTAPDPDLVPAAVLPDGKIEAADLVLSSGDASEVTYEFTQQPILSMVGVIECTVKSTDAAGNSSEKKGKILVCDKLIELEASTDMLTEKTVLKALGSEYSGYKLQSEPFLLNELGAHAVTLTNGSNRIVVGITVKDTKAPTAEGTKCDCSTGYYCQPIKFAKNISDISRVTARFVNEPDWDTEGEQPVEIILSDRAGNETKISSTAVISPDKQAPVIYAARDRYCYVGEAVSYFKEVFAEDNADPEPELDVDKSKVNAKQAGTYDVTYTATDHEGNSSSVTVKFIFIEKKISDEMLNEEVDKVLGEILDDEMTLSEQAYAIFNYCYSNIIYTGTSDKTDWKSEAYRGLTEGVGDCFTFYSASYALLQKIDCQVLSVERLNGQTQHFWCLVNLGTGWYHFDSCNAGPKNLKCFMKTTAELDEYSYQYYWRYDTSMYPALETTPFSMS